VLRTHLRVWAETLDEVAGAQAKALGSNGAHATQFRQKLTHQKSVYSAIAMGDIRVIDLFVHDTMYTQHLPSGASCPQALCCVCVVSRTKRSIAITYSTGYTQCHDLIGANMYNTQVPPLDTFITLYFNIHLPSI